MLPSELVSLTTTARRLSRWRSALPSSVGSQTHEVWSIAIQRSGVPSSLPSMRWMSRECEK